MFSFFALGFPHAKAGKLSRRPKEFIPAIWGQGALARSVLTSKGWTPRLLVGVSHQALLPGWANQPQEGGQGQTPHRGIARAFHEELGGEKEGLGPEML